MWIGVTEILIGIAGIAIAFTGRVNRASLLIAIGIGLFGLSHLGVQRWNGWAGDIGALFVLFGLGMSLSSLRRGRKKGR